MIKTIIPKPDLPLYQRTVSTHTHTHTHWRQREKIDFNAQSTTWYYYLSSGQRQRVPGLSKRERRRGRLTDRWTQIMRQTSELIILPNMVWNFYVVESRVQSQEQEQHQAQIIRFCIFSLLLVRLFNLLGTVLSLRVHCFSTTFVSF